MEKKNEQEKCPPKVVPVDGGFGQWSAWAECAPKSEDRPNDEFKTRSRECNNPVPANGGNNCDALGPKTEEKECPPKPIDGGFSAWSEWTKCGADDKVQSRNRECNNPKPNFGGKNCDALGKKMEEKECPKPPTWTPWTPWTDCSVTCGSGTQSRSRTCPVKDACPGLPSETKGCEKDACDSVVRCP